MIKKRPNASFASSLFGFFGKSAIVQTLCRFTSNMYRKFIYGFFGTVFTIYGFLSDKMEDSFLANLFSRKKDDRRQGFAYKMSYFCETSIVSRISNGIKRSVLYCPLNLIGIIGFSFGFYSLAIIFLKRFALAYEPVSELSFYVCVISIIVSVFLLFSKKTLISVINESLFCNFIFFDFLSIRKVSSSEYEESSRINAGVAVILGIVFGGLSFVIKPYITVFLLLAVIGSVIVLHSPESGSIVMFLILPFMPTMFLVGFTIMVAVSLFLKVIRRKRIIKLTFIDISVIAFILFLVSGGFLSVDATSSIPKMLVFVCFISFYFIVKNVIRSEKLAYNCIRGISFSAAVVAFIGIIQYFFGSVSTKWQDVQMFADIKGRAVSKFQNPNVLAEYLILVIPVIFAMLLISGSARSRFRYFISLMLCCACLMLTWSRGAWLGFVFAVLLFIFFSSHKTFAYLLLSIPGICFIASYFVDTSVINRFMSIGNTADSSTLYRLNIWKGTLAMLDDGHIFGIGIGTEAFSSVYPQYSLSGIEAAPHSHSLYLQITTEMGIFALIVFLLFCISFIGMIFSTFKRCSLRKSKMLLLGFLCGFCAFLVQGATDYVWYNYRIFLLFWAMVGLAAAIANNCKENDRGPYLR